MQRSFTLNSNSAASRQQLSRNSAETQITASATRQIDADKLSHNSAETQIKQRTEITYRHTRQASTAPPVMPTSTPVMQASLTNKTIFPATDASTACRGCVCGGQGKGAGPSCGHPVRRLPALPDIAHTRDMALQALVTTMTTTRATTMTTTLKVPSSLTILALDGV